MRIACLPAVLVAAACSTQELARDHTLDIVRNVNKAFSRETNLGVAEAAFPASLKQMEGLLEMYPDEPLLLRSLARGYLSYTYAFVEVRADAAVGVHEGLAKRAALREARPLYLRARGYALRLLALHEPELVAQLEQSELPPKEQLDAVGVESVPGMYWTARCWAAALAIQERTPEVVRDATIVRSLVTRCVALDETYDHAGPLVLQGALDAVTPQVMGGGVEVAQARYERAMELQKGRHLLTRVMYARDVLAPLKERELFRQTLQQVVTADPDEDPDLALLSRVAQRRALLFRGSEHLFFDMQ